MNKIGHYVFLLALAFSIRSEIVLGVGAADAVGRLQKIAEAQRPIVLEEEAKKEGAFSFYGTMSTDHSNRLLSAFRARYPFLKINHAQEFGRGPTRKGVKSKYSRLDHPKYVVVPAESLAPRYKKRLEQYQQVFGFR
jgi:hypothetical protein